jgi:hypothetical protein
MRELYLLGGIMIASIAGGLTACSDELSLPSEASAPTTSETGSEALTTGSIRLRCERRSDRSKISVDGRDLSPRGGTFRARVRAAGGTATSGTRRAVGDEVEFDFDSDPGDVREGATRIAASFIRARAGADVVAELLNLAGNVVASRGADCEFR